MDGDSVNNRRLIVTSLVSIILVCVLFIGNTLSIETLREVDENLNYYTTGNLDISYYVKSGEIVLNNSYPMSYEDAMQLDPYRITVYNNGNVDYEFSLILSDETETNKIDYKYINVQVGINDPICLDSTENNVIMDKIVVKASSSVDIDIFVWVSDDIPNSEIGKGFYAKVNIDGFAVSDADDSNNSSLIYNLDSSGTNRPMLDSNMIPVYYDNELDVWKKADINNRNKDYQWYDYDNKIWANAVLVKESGIHNRAYYLSDEAVGQEVNINDIIAFYVWIPRYKYRVWNITRSSDVDINDIDIMFENNTNSTGNIKCEYNDKNDNEFFLSDNCYYNNTLISTDMNNSNYTDVWYTHPAFTYGNKNITGFWIGKFETTGSSTGPTILPDQISLRSQIVKEQFDTSKIFNNYGLENLDAHMERNLEYGALLYLTNSIYGVCNSKEDNILCNSIYNNNSSDYYTGSGSLDGDEVRNYGTYNYQGYLIDNVSNSRIITKVNKTNVIASSTLNIYGVYDLAGGAMERVLGVSQSIDGIDSQYYDLYTNGTTSGYNLRSRLGDGTIEYSAKDNYFIYDDNYIFVRGNLYNDSANIFSYNVSDGSSDSKYSFRVVLS